MPLTPGTRLGAYEVTAPLGKGGMGEVYRATDLKLKRDVALKVLPTSLADDPMRLARFQREAEVLASLNHSNIAQIYGLEEANGIRAIVMELVDGETLADIIKRGPIPVETAIAYAKQIASALEYAHDKAKPVIHRDLKPANIQVTPDGIVKVLDFGLAKALADEPATTSIDPDNSPTLTMGNTVVGMILGTAAYMSPEQAKGKPLDRRSDIWSFGVVFFEMVTGKRLFTGEEVGDILAAIVLQEPKLDAVPPRLRPAIDRCLRKDPRKRWYSMEDVRFALDEEPPPSSTLPTPSRDRQGAVWPLALTAVSLILAATISFLHFREIPPEQPVVKTSLLPPADGIFDFNQPYPLPAISPDGTRLVYGGRGKDGKRLLWLRRLDTPEAQPLPGTDNAATPFWSPDSRWVAFGQDLKLKKIDVQGGPPVSITDIQAGGLRGGTWNAGGTILYATSTGESPIMRVAASGSTPTAASEAGARSPWFLPDGRHFLYLHRKAEEITVRVGSLDEPGKPGKVVAPAQSTAIYSQGHLLFVREGSLMAQPFDLDRLETNGEASPLAEGISTYTTTLRMVPVTASTNGMLAFLSGTLLQSSRLVWRDRQGKLLGNLGDSLGNVGNLSLSPDGKSAAASIQISPSVQDIWISDTTRGLPTRFTFDPGLDREPIWSPDGKWLYFDSVRKGNNYSIYRKASNGTGADELVFSEDANSVPHGISPDGKLLLFQRTGKDSLADLWTLPLAQIASGKVEPQSFLKTQFAETRGSFSPDGNWVVYQSNESGEIQIYAAPFPGPGGKRQISTNGGIDARWSRNGKEIFYVTPDGSMMAAEVAARNGTLEIGKVEKLFDGVKTTAGITYDVTADGNFLMADNGLSSMPMTLLQNWVAALRK